MSHYPDPNFNANCRLTIKNLPQDKDPVIIQKLLLELFTQVGPVFKISLNTSPAPTKISSSRSKNQKSTSSSEKNSNNIVINSCFVDFVYEDSPSYAAKALVGTKFFGNSLIYEYDNQFQTSEKTQTNSSYTVQNGRPNTHIIHVDLDEEVDNEELEKDQKALSGWDKSSSSKSKHMSKSTGNLSNSGSGTTNTQPSKGQPRRGQSHSKETAGNNSRISGGSLDNDDKSKHSSTPVTPLFKIRGKNGPPAQRPNFSNQQQRQYMGNTFTNKEGHLI